MLFLLLGIAYVPVHSLYSYMLTGFELDFNISRTLISLVFFSIALALLKKINDPTIKFIYNVSLPLLLYGECICYAFNSDSNPASLIGVLIFLILLVAFQKIKIKPKRRRQIKNSFPLLLVLSIVLFIPFVILYHDKINLNNLFLDDIYETRMSFRGDTNPIIGYITAPLSRVLLPALSIMALKDKKYSYAIICVAMAMFIFLCGALKSILFGIIAALLFYKGTYEQKTKRLIIGLIVAIILGLLLQHIFDNQFIINLIRRVFFVPPRLNSAYANYFADNFTYLSHSPLGLGIHQSDIETSSLSMYFGEKILGASGLNANVGIIIEGFISFGYIGILVFSTLAALIVHFFRYTKIRPLFAGILIVYIYYMNTAFLSTFLLTHGLIFLMIFAYLFMSGDKYETK